MQTDEPVSVRIARAKGCEPIRPLDAWFCPCREAHSPTKGGTRDGYWLSVGQREMWLTPAASFALLTEMVEAKCFIDIAPSGYECQCPDTRPFVGFIRPDDEDYGYEYKHWHFGSLGDGIALAWLAWKGGAAS